MTPAFLQAAAWMLRHEGGDSDHLADRGKRTRFGISAASHPNEDISQLTLARALEIYYQDYWQDPHLQLELLTPLEVAIKVFDFAVVAGPVVSAKTLQSALLRFGVSVKVDGYAGVFTRDRVKSEVAGHGSGPLLAMLAGLQWQHFVLIVDRNPTQRVFLAGWVRRAHDVPCLG